MNQVRTAEHRAVGPRIVASCRERLDVSIEHAGSIESDPNVLAAVERRQPALQAFPSSRFSRQIEALARRLHREVPGGARDEESEPPTLRLAADVSPRDADDGARPSPVPGIDREAPGSYLRRCREALGLSLAEMTERTRIRILDQIENECFELLPPEPYLKGYLFEYARALELPDVADLANCYLAKAPARPAQSAPLPVRSARSWWTRT